jgi:NitT/TauT family transport system substrate-binding protein
VHAARAPSLKPEVELQKIKATAPMLTSADTQANGIGYFSKSWWEQAQSLMHDFGGLTKVESDVSAFYTNEFLPKP